MEIAILTIPVDGRWTLDDLDEFAESFRISYSYFYIVAEEPTRDDDRMRFIVQRYFWSGSYQGEQFANRIYAVVRGENEPFVKRFEYASPGLVEIGGSILVLGLLARVVRAWINAGDAAFKLYQNIDKYFENRKLTKIPKNFSLDRLTSADLDAARALSFELGQMLNLGQEQVERVINLAGNPISALKLLVQIVRECERLGRLDKAGKAKMSRARLTAQKDAKDATD